MQRALGRAYQRLQGAHPRRQDTASGRAAEIACDALLVAAGAALIGGLGLVAASLVGGFDPARLALGAGLVAASPALLLVWERLAWEPFAKRLARMD
ncbi:MAG TPA: hypothetical protein VMT68_15295 [Caulobacteraceae bacterium]|nr:hypothetical protein [Caulobacteraceae bacterium]